MFETNQTRRGEEEEERLYREEILILNSAVSESIEDLVDL